MPKASPSHASHEIINNDNEIRISVDLPGVKKTDIALTAEDGTIAIEATRRRLTSDGSTAKNTRISKSFAVDHQTIDLSNIKANLADGVLVVVVPKKAKSESRIITITVKPHEEHGVVDKEDTDDSKKHVEEPAKLEDEKQAKDNKEKAGSNRKKAEKKPKD